MDKVVFDKYVEERYKDQMKFYSDRSKLNQKKYRQFQWWLIILSAITPVLAALGGKSYKFGPFTLSTTDLQIMVVTISALVAILTSLLKTFRYQEFWVNYRSTNEKLKPEIYYYNFNVGPYVEPDVDKESLFVMRVEAILDEEHKQWPALKKAQEDQDKSKDTTGATEPASAPDAENVNAEAQPGTADAAPETELKTTDLPSETQPESTDVTDEVQSGVPEDSDKELPK